MWLATWLMTTDLASLVATRLREYDSLRDAGRKLGVCHVWLHRLATGKRVNASDETLAKLGIKRTVTVTYEEIK